VSSTRSPNAPTSRSTNTPGPTTMTTTMTSSTITVSASDGEPQRNSMARALGLVWVYAVARRDGGRESSGRSGGRRVWTSISRSAIRRRAPLIFEGDDLLLGSHDAAGDVHAAARPVDGLTGGSGGNV